MFTTHILIDNPSGSRNLRRSEDTFRIEPNYMQLTENKEYEELK